MSLFRKKKNCLGFDLSKKSVKVVELTQGEDKPTLVTYGGLELPSYSLESNNQKTKDVVVKTIQEVLKRAHTSTKNIIASLPPQRVFNSVLSVPKVSDNELPEAIKWEAKQYIPAPLEDVIIDWQKIGEDEKSKKSEIYIVAAPKNLVQKYIELYQSCGLNPIALEIDPLALVRSLVGTDQQALILIDIGAYETSISVVEQGVLRFCRSITSGGETITKAIASNLNVDEARAEQFKKDFGINTAKLEGQVLKSIQPIINNLLTEIKRSIEFYKTEGKGEIKKIILSGGGAKLPELTTYLTKNLDIEARIGNPWDNINYSKELTNHLNEIGSAFAVAIGLAMRKI
jgi:type IV pilus assembly protein PilM